MIQNTYGSLLIYLLFKKVFLLKNLEGTRDTGDSHIK